MASEARMGRRDLNYRAVASERENERLREALELIAESAWTPETAEDCAKACKSIATKALAGATHR